MKKIKRQPNKESTERGAEESRVKGRRKDKDYNGNTMPSDKTLNNKTIVTSFEIFVLSVAATITKSS